MKIKLYKTPPPYSIVLANSGTTMEVKAIEFHRMNKCIKLYSACNALNLDIMLFAHRHEKQNRRIAQFRSRNFIPGHQMSMPGHKRARSEKLG